MQSCSATPFSKSNCQSIRVETGKNKRSLERTQWSAQSLETRDLHNPPNIHPFLHKGTNATPRLSWLPGSIWIWSCMFWVVVTCSCCRVSKWVLLRWWGYPHDYSTGWVLFWHSPGPLATCLLLSTGPPQDFTRHTSRETKGATQKVSAQNPVILDWTRLQHFQAGNLLLICLTSWLTWSLLHWWTLCQFNNVWPGMSWLKVHVLSMLHKSPHHSRSVTGMNLSCTEVCGARSAPKFHCRFLDQTYPSWTHCMGNCLLPLRIWWNANCQHSKL